MTFKLKPFLLSTLLSLLGLFVPAELRAQFLGYTAPQTVQQKLFTGQTSPATTPTFTINCTPVNGAPCGIQNIGQTIHQLTYVAVPSTCTPDFRLEASQDGSTWFTISEDSQGAGTGTIYAYGYFPALRANFASLGSTCTSASAFYAGTSAGLPTDQGIFTTASRQSKTLVNNLTANNVYTSNVTAPFGNSAGIIWLIQTGAFPASNCTLNVKNTYTNGNALQINNLGTLGAGNTFYNVPATPGATFTVQFVGCGATATNITLIYSFDPVFPRANAFGAALAAVSPSGLTPSSLTEKGPRWSLNNAGVGAQASVTQAAATANIRHVADCVTASAGATTAPVATVLTINLRDGASGAGTVLWTTQIVAAATAANHGNIFICGLNLVGSANTAMTLEFSAALGNEAQSVTLTGYDVY